MFVAETRADCAGGADELVIRWHGMQFRDGFPE